MFTVDEKTTTALGWPFLLGHLAKRCNTTPGRERALALPWLTTAEEVEQELTLVAQTRSCRDRGEPLPFGQIWDLRPALRRLEKDGTLDGSTLIQIAQTLQGGSRLRRFLLKREEQVPELAIVASGIAALDDVSGPIMDSFDERGNLVDHASQDLKRLRQQVINLHDQISRSMRRLMERPEISKYLQDTFYTQREDRYVLPIRTDSGSSVKGIVHGSSSSGATLFIEPQEMVAANNELKVAELEVAREEARIYSELSGLVGEEIEAIEKNLSLLQQLDFLDARARLAIDLNASQPLLNKDGKVELYKIRHPLMVLAGMEVVPNNLELNDAQTLIITGPNAGGKTVTLKTLGLCALMCRAGMHLPAGLDSQIPLYDSVLTEMGDDQSIEQNLSTFTAHLSHLLDYLEAAKPNTLILLDEIAVGTDPGEGEALAQALLEAFTESGAQLVVTTHYERLKSLAVTQKRFVNWSVGFDMEAMRPTYHLHRGTPGRSGALDVARRLGLTPRLADRAAELLEGGGQELSALLAALSGERTKLIELQEEAERTTTEAKRLAEKYKTQLAQLERREKDAFESEFKEALDDLRRARQELSRVQMLLRRKESDKKRLKQADRQISEAASEILKHEPHRSPRGQKAKPEDLTIGKRVTVQRLGGNGEVLEPPHRGKVMIRVGGIRTQVSIDEVLIPQGEAKAPKRAASKSPSKASPDKPSVQTPLAASRAPVRTAYNTLDLRGFRVDEALAETDRFIDHALRAEEQVLMIIHGHGTGALRSAIREYLAGMSLVQRFEPAPPPDGGDGVTVLWLGSAEK